MGLAPVVIAAIVGAAASGGTAVGTSVYQSRQNRRASDRLSARERSAAMVAETAANRAFQLGKEQLDYDRWLTRATGQARQPYMDMVAGAGAGGGDYSPAPYAAAEPFAAPTREAAATDPGYQMAEGEGNRLVETSAASRGNLLTGGTLQDLQAHGARRATGQYDKVYDRAFNAYAMREGLRGQGWDRNTGAGFRAAGLRGQGSEARTRALLSLAQMAGAGEYPGYVTPGSRTIIPPPGSGGGVKPGGVPYRVIGPSENFSEAYY